MSYKNNTEMRSHSTRTNETVLRGGNVEMDVVFYNINLANGC